MVCFCHISFCNSLNKHSDDFCLLSCLPFFSLLLIPFHYIHNIDCDTFLHKCLTTSQITSLGKISSSGLQETKCWTSYGSLYTVWNNSPEIPCRQKPIRVLTPLHLHQYFIIIFIIANLVGYSLNHWVICISLIPNEVFNTFHVSCVFKFLFLWFFIYPFVICEILTVPLIISRLYYSSKGIGKTF